MMRTCHLSTLLGKEANTAKLISFLRSCGVQSFASAVTAGTSSTHTGGSPSCGGGTVAPPAVASTSASPSTGSRPTSAKPALNVDVYLQVHDAHRSTFLDHAQSLYNTALEFSADLSMDVIPVLRADEAGGGLELECFTKASMIAHGFSPLYQYVACGGTFDHLHSGHKLLLSTAVLFATDRLRVGVTGDALLQKKKFSSHLQPYGTRRAHVEQFLRKIRHDVELEVEMISDVSGGTDRIAAVEALVVSPETEKSLGLINDLRQRNGGMPPMKPILIPYVHTAEGRIISSTQLRERIQKAGEEGIASSPTTAPP